MAGIFHVGVSGFSYPKWKPKFYPEGVKREEFLRHYSSRLGSVEINSTFYSLPSASMVENWSKTTTEKFKFAFKAPGQITHVKKLGPDSFGLVDRVSRTLGLLGPRRGPILFQLPPYLKHDDDLLDRFLTGTSGVENRVFEFRHSSWLQESTYRLLDERHAGFCIAETEELAPVFEVTGGIAYFRLRKDSYDAKAIDRWSAKISETAREVPEIYVYLRHDETGENAVLAQRLSKALQV